MSGLRKSYCIFGCDKLVAHNAPLHRFPNPEKCHDLFSTWMEIIGDALKEKDPRKVYKNKRICDLHFDSKHKTTGGRLLLAAVPTINLHSVKQSLQNVVALEHNYCCKREVTHSRPMVDITNVCVPSGVKTPIDLRNKPGQTSSAVQMEIDSLKLSQASGSALNIIDHTSQKFDEVKTTLYLKKKDEVNRGRKERQMRNEISRLRLKIKKFKSSISTSKILNRSTKADFHKLTRNMTESAKLFTRMQYMEGYKKKKGRRFQLKEKILSLSLYKKSPKAYKLMCRYFTLPSIKVIKCLLAQIKLSPGINDIVFEQLKTTVEKISPQDRLCSLVFDEMSLVPHIHYNAHTDDLVGFENYGDDKTERFANHALVFMVKGVRRNFKQPVAYFFTQTLQSVKLKKLVIQVITKVQATGLQIVATVCDQSSVNVTVINSLISDAKRTYSEEGKEWRNDVILINNRQIIPLFDVPHLLKGIRNNLLNKELQYFHDNNIKTVKWEHFQRTYAADRSHGELRLLPLLTDEHIDPNKIKKMRVKNAAQVLSFSMARAIENLVARKDIPSECFDAIPFLLLIDKLFDSLNASSFSVQNGKIYRGAVRKNSPHHQLWQEALILLKSVRFVVEKSNGEKSEKSVPSVNNFVRTIEGFKSLWQLLFKNYGFDAFLTRNVNQDPLENFFGSVRSLGARNIAPNCVGFEGAFKTLLLNNFSSNHSISANCEEDKNKCLQSLSFFIKNKEKYFNAPSGNSQNIVINEPLKLLEEKTNISDLGADQRNYVCGWALKKCLRLVVKGCTVCKNKLLGNPENELNTFVKRKEFMDGKQWLCYPSDCLVTYFKQIQDTTIAFLNNDCHKKNIKERIKACLDLFLNFKLNCDEHEDKFKKCFIDTAINIIIYSWCRSVNAILDGKIKYEGDDTIKKAAVIYYNKHRNHK